MPDISIPFLPKPRLLEFLQTQCQVDAEDPTGPFTKALDLDLTHIDSKAAVELVLVTDLHITAESVVVSYDVHYRIFDGCKGVDVTSYLDKKVTGRRSANGWRFQQFRKPEDRSTVNEF
jgi:hypothetical protein